jgi:hypothetical protein
MNNKTCLTLVFVAVASLSACVYAPPAPPPAPAPPRESLTKVYFYPAQNQSAEQQDRDRYDCYVWAVDETGFDPARRIAPRDTRATVVPARSPGETVAATAAAGAVIGAIAADRGETGKGAVVGAIAGTVLGSAIASSEAEQASAVQARSSPRGYGRYEREAAEYRRAMSACLEGRGYSVR